MSQKPFKLAPLLSVRHGRRAIDFYKAAFGVEERFCITDDKGEVVATLGIGDVEFWVADESPPHDNYSPETVGGSTSRMILYVDDPDALVARALAAGASEVWPVAEQYGWRVGRIVDPFGHHWEIGHPLPSAG